MVESMTEYQKGSAIINALVKGNDATVALTLAVLRTIPIVPDPTESWQITIPVESRISKDLAMQALEWESVTTSAKSLENEKELVSTYTQFVKSAQDYLGHAPSQQEICHLVPFVETQVVAQKRRDDFLRSFESSIRQLKFDLKKAIELQPSLTRLLQEYRSSPEGKAAAHRARAEEASIDQAMRDAKAWLERHDQKK